MPRTYNGKGGREKRLIDWTAYLDLLGTVSDKEIADMIGCTDTAVRDHREKLGISPKFKTHWTRDEEDEFAVLRSEGKQRCRKCLQVKLLAEFDRSAKANGREGHNRWCKQCKSTYQTARIQERRAYWIPLAGGCCQHCGYNRYSVSLDFHHVSGDDKEWSPGRLMISRPRESVEVRAELDKCSLLCCNCHQAIHRGELVLEFVKRDTLGWTVKK